MGQTISANISVSLLEAARGIETLLKHGTLSISQHFRL